MENVKIEINHNIVLTSSGDGFVFHYESERNVTKDEAKAVLRGYLKNGSEGCFNGMCRKFDPIADHHVFYFEGGYFICTKLHRTEEASFYFKEALKKYGDGDVVRPAATWTVVVNNDGRFELTDAEGYSFLVKYELAVREFPSPTWSLYSIDSRNAIMATMDGLTVHTPPNQKLSLETNIPWGLMWLLEKPYQNCADTFETIARWLKKED